MRTVENLNCWYLASDRIPPAFTAVVCMDRSKNIWVGEVDNDGQWKDGKMPVVWQRLSPPLDLDLLPDSEVKGSGKNL